MSARTRRCGCGLRGRAAAAVLRALVRIAGAACLAAALAPGAGVLPAGAVVRPAGPGAAFAPVATGPAAASWNPAGLSLGPERRLEILSLQAALGNDGYTLEQYSELNGAVWGEDEKRMALDALDGQALTMNGRAALRAAGVSLGSFALTSETRGASYASLPPQALELLLYGNTVGETFDLSGARAVGVAYTELRLSAAAPARRLLSLAPAGWEDWHVGASAKLLMGWGYAELVEARGGVTTTVESLSGEGYLRSAIAHRGRGFAFDLGVAGRLGGGWIVSAAARDLAARLTWTGGARERTDRFEAPAISLGDGEEIAVTESVTVPLARITTHLPAVYSAGVAHTGDRLLAALHVEAAGSGRMGASSALRASAGASWTARPWLALRTTLSLGGEDAASLGAGAGLAFGSVQLDLGLRSWGGLNPFASKGLGAETSIGLAL